MLTLILSLLGLGGVGTAALLFPPFGAMLLGFGKSALAIAAKLPWQVYAIAALAAVVAFLIISRGHFMHRAHADEGQLASICEKVRIADANPHLDCAKVSDQILLLGQALQATTKAIGEQNAAIERLAKQTADEQQISAKAEKVASQRADAAQATAQRLDRSSRSAPAGGAPAGTCAPSPTLLEQWP